jgi:cytochrome c551/c552
VIPVAVQIDDDATFKLPSSVFCPSQSAPERYHLSNQTVIEQMVLRYMDAPSNLVVCRIASCCVAYFSQRGLLRAFAIICLIASAGSVSSVCPAQEQSNDSFFENSIRPLLIEHCLKCHGPDKSEGGLRLDSQDAAFRGGDSGAAIVPQKTDESLIIQAINHDGLEMPPNKKLSDKEIDALTRWVNEGAAWPEYATSLISSGSATKEFTEADKNYWAFKKPIVKPLVTAGSTTNPIDAFVREKQQAVGLTMAEPATDAVLVRRAYLDLLGVIPSWQETQAYLNDPRTDRYELLIDQMLNDPRYGERWGRYWLDLVRFAESDGYKQDSFRPTGYVYRDYVVRSLNDDKSYGQFIKEQLAGDEIDPTSQEMIAATGYLRLWIYEYNQRDVKGQWESILNDVTDVSGEVFLGLSFGCARCHDHKFDAILQKDYYRLQAFFAPMIPRYDIPVSYDQQSVFDLAIKQTPLEKFAAARGRIAELESEIRRSTIESNIEKFPPEIRPALRKSDAERDAWEKQIAQLAFLQIENELNGIDFSKRLKGNELDEWKSRKDELKELEKDVPPSPERALAIRDASSVPPKTFIPGKESVGPVEAGVLSILDPNPMNIPVPAITNTTGRRLALANWMIEPDNPLTWRTIVNRVWQHHFGRGIVANASDFGRLTEPPSHPELLDWLAVWFVERGGSLKSLHRLIMTSQTYRQSAYPSSLSETINIDPENVWLARFRPRRLDAEQIRDSILVATGEIDWSRGGASDEKESNRRSIYLRSMRNNLHAMLSAFDRPDGSSTLAKRNVTNTSIQSLYMTNAPWPLARAQSLADSLLAQAIPAEQCIRSVYNHIYLREPSSDELNQAIAFLNQRATQIASSQNDASQFASTENAASSTPNRDCLIDLVHVLFSSNEFLYVE